MCLPFDFSSRGFGRLGDETQRSAGVMEDVFRTYTCAENQILLAARMGLCWNANRSGRFSSANWVSIQKGFYEKCLERGRSSSSFCHIPCQCHSAIIRTAVGCAPIHPSAGHGAGVRTD
jgi:hypothetical protein